MDLLEIGTALREGREGLGLSLGDVEDRIKIARSVLAALESGERNRFPHPVYAKGFVRSYTSMLGLDTVELCAHFSREYPVSVDAENEEEHTAHITVKVGGGRHFPWLRAVALAAVIVGACVAVWYAYDVFSRQDFRASVFELLSKETFNAPVLPPVVTQQRVKPSAPLTQMTEVRTAEDDARNASIIATEATADAFEQPLESILSAKASNATTGNATGSAVSVETGSNAFVVQKEQNATLPVAVQASASVTDPGKERTLVITAHAATWLQARPDGKVLDYFLRKDESATVSFSQSLSIKFGNAGGVLMTLDGRPYPFDAKAGEVKTLVIQ